MIYWSREFSFSISSSISKVFSERRFLEVRFLSFLKNLSLKKALKECSVVLLFLFFEQLYSIYLIAIKKPIKAMRISTQLINIQVIVWRLNKEKNNSLFDKVDVSGERILDNEALKRIAKDELKIVR